MYLPMGMISGRYAMPAVWGVDILFALLLDGRRRARPAHGLEEGFAWAGVCTGLAVVAVANVGRQEKFAARAGHALGRGPVRGGDGPAGPRARGRVGRKAGTAWPAG